MDRRVHERELRRAGVAPDELEVARLHASLRDRLFGDARPTLVAGRYRVKKRIGAGGMGVVYQAHDEALDRDVALKVVNRSGATADDSTSTRARLRAEARTMARVSDPHIVEVFDVRQVGDAFVIAMELCPGIDLQQWLRAEPRSPAEILTVFIAAGRGLAAAHRAGVVHRDFKPTNVMVGGDPRDARAIGRVRVLDFGLARLLDPLETPPMTRAIDAHGDPMGDTGSSTTGQIMGTPAYMAPEQHRGLRPTPAADQYAFCVSLWEALSGERPFAGSSLAELAMAKLDGPPPWPGRRRVPGAVVRAIARGLAPRPEDRWPSIDELLRALAPRSPWRWYAAAGVGVAGAIAVALSPAPSRPCSDAEAQLDGTWDRERRREIETALRRLDAAWIEAAAVHVPRELDRYANEWATQYLEACEATNVHAEQPAEVLDLRMACLREARLGLRAVSDAFADADVQLAQRAWSLVGDLPPLDRCADVAALRRDVAPPEPDDADAVERAMEALASARVSAAAGRYDAARTAIEEAKAHLHAANYGPARAEVALAEGRLLSSLGEFERAAERLRDALDEATRWGHVDAMQQAARISMAVLGSRLQRPEEALRFLGLAEELAHGDPLRLALVRHAHGRVLQVQGRYDAAERELKEAILLGEHAPVDTPTLSGMRTDLANTLLALDRVDEARAELERALSVQLDTLGPMHPDVGATRSALARALVASGEHAAGEAEYRRAIAVLEGTLGLSHPNVATAYTNLATALLSQQRADEAEVELRRALAIHTEALGPNDRHVMESRVGLAQALSAKGQLKEAEAELRLALEICEITLGAEHPHAAAIRNNLGVVLEDQGALAEALEHYQRALQIDIATLGASHSRTETARENIEHLRAALRR